MRIKRLEFIDEIIKLEHSISDSTGKSILNISHWDPGRVYQKNVHSVMKLTKHIDPIKYIYGYRLSSEYKQKVLLNLGVGFPASNCVLMQSSTPAIVMLANLLKYKGINKVCILQPSYFSVGLCFDFLKIETYFLNLKVEKDKFIIPSQEILNSGCEAVWITSPVFCIGRYYDDNQLENINDLIRHNLLVVCDEALCEPGREVMRKIPPSRYFISFYSPHKVIVVNAIKFAVVVCHDEYIGFLEHLTDAFHGGLFTSNMIAIEHYLSGNYNACFEVLNCFTKKNLHTIRNIISDKSDVVLMNDTHGQYATIFMPYVTYNKTLSIQFIEEIIHNTYTSILPGHTMGFDEEYGFCFRINLTLDPNLLKAAVHKIIGYLQLYRR